MLAWKGEQSLKAMQQQKGEGQENTVGISFLSLSVSCR